MILDALQRGDGERAEALHQEQQAMEAKMKEPFVTPLYGVIYIDIVKAARELGYAVAIHGSVQRDLDLVAIPWTIGACDPQTLVDAVIRSCRGWVLNEKNRNPETKPHGRLSWSIHLDQYTYIDLSVMPRTEVLVFTEDGDGQLD